MTSQTFTFSEPPPSTNGLFASAGNRRIRSEKYKAWASAAEWELKLQKPRLMEGDLRLTIDVKRPRSNADVSNRIKALEDLLAGWVFVDDRQVVDVRARWADVPGAVVTVEPA